MEENKSFHYTYSAEQQQEIRDIRKKYLAPEEDKMEQLRRLDRCAAQKAQAWSIVLGVTGTLIFGLGMSCAMTDLTGFLGGTALMIGIPVSVVGLAVLALAYPVYNSILKKERQRIAPLILQLTDELLK
ncbi:MAG: hypothetical protein IJ412_11315 [Oscillospiraceae bacterium]|nr:hypothetical protein [Oscillospiraceae bacterium]